ncbi:GNAT family N-acetyltransferase [Stackebrandtia nassauensis]|uniref:GCN5-related N-acetyltransferase n=1 Tax=Stackebrandtia nassauensis (strain DSM 44728 / CIP 108903 / NRRL B-16338 / NBRC 102104 / LLR-40K-21) TaxID=446470 RepID=D3Q2Q3_STANL|nr:GNAT family N-acetyltransferase [Stackebrandtia nassauensis]ADD45804.1 GCN5-related N-acetyltransferase [Stackebrandtia nassauensis DSM 44728]
MSEVRLRDCVAADLETFYANETDADAARRVNFPPRTREAFLAHWNDRILADPGVVKRTVVVDARVAGNIVCWDAEGEREVGYWFGREFWGRGIGTAAVRAFVDGVPWRPLYAKAAAANIASVRLLEKCGFAFDSAFAAPNAYGDGEVEHVKTRLD